MTQREYRLVVELFVEIVVAQRHGPDGRAARGRKA